MELAGRWIESTGLPGVGKTTEILSNRDSIGQGFMIVETRTANTPTLLVAGLLYSLSYRRRVDDTVLARKLAYRRAFQIFIPRSRRVIFFDSGVVQVVIENLIETDFAQIDQKLGLMKEITVTDTLLYFNDDIPRIVERETMRQKRRFPGLDRNELDRRYRKAQALTEEFIFPIFQNVTTIEMGGAADREKRAQ